jgi:hypothetical protein
MKMNISTLTTNARYNTDSNTSTFNIDLNKNKEAPHSFNAEFKFNSQVKN